MIADRGQWVLLIKWVSAVTIAGAAYWSIGMPVAYGFCRAFGLSGGPVADSIECSPIVMAVCGALLGTMQWLLLRRLVSQAGWWILASSIGWAMGVGIWVGAIVWAMNWTPGLVPHRITSEAVGGALLGVMQWLVLRRHVSRAGWWIMASSLGWLMGGIAGAAGFKAISGVAALPMRGVFVQLAVGGSVLGIVYGTVTGIALVRVLRYSIREAGSPSS